MKKISIWQYPYDKGFSICDKNKIDIDTGLTVLVGCNGIGKTTTLNNIYEELKKDNIPVFRYSNLTDKSEDNISTMVMRWTSSEGENISINVGEIFSKIKLFMKTGNMSKSIKSVESNERWLLFDAVDSGYSIDNVIDLKKVFNLILEDAKKSNLDFYIVISANEYELANDTNCLDVTTGDYIKFKDYEDYKDFILATRVKKNNRFKE